MPTRWLDRHIFATTPLYGVNGLGGVANDQALPFSGQPAQDASKLPSNTPKGVVQRPETAVQVTVGKDGWLYLQGVFDRACSPFIDFGVAASRWEGLLRVIRQSGRRAVLIVPPDKSTIYPEHVAPGTANLACGLNGTAALWRVIEDRTAVGAGVVGLRRPLLAIKRSSHDPLYYLTDSHWNNVGSLAFVEPVLAALNRRVRMSSSEIVDPGPVRYSGDLLGLLGQSGSEMAPRRTIQRAPGAAVITSPAVIVGDSYAEVAAPLLSPYFGSLKLTLWYGNSLQQIADNIAGARDVVLEVVEREFDYHASDAGVVTPQFIQLVRATLAAHPLR